MGTKIVAMITALMSLIGIGGEPQETANLDPTPIVWTENMEVENIEIETIEIETKEIETKEIEIKPIQQDEHEGQIFQIEDWADVPVSVTDNVVFYEDNIQSWNSNHVQRWD